MRRNSRKKKVKCCVCARQIVSYPVDGKYAIGGKPVTRMFGDDCCCYICAEELDENGLFPEERILA